MITAGIDIGSSTSKAVLIDEGDMLSYSIMPTGAESVNSARRVMADVLDKAGISAKDVSYILATGYGRVIVPFANEALTELTCHARGAHFLFPNVRTILDMGGQDCKAIRCDANGQLLNFVMNDKCAAGTGRFLELIARVLGVSLDALSDLALKATATIKINSTCAVFAKSEVTSLIREGKNRCDVIAGLHDAIAMRVFNLLRGVGIESQLAITGGLGKNKAIIREIEKKTDLNCMIAEEPQIVGALGAALFARDKFI
ncbi:MAG: 2-hydroxyglutaryl-CoA dehydratase [Deltaproteobacteria bacterium]|nr:2-hydroxyglutaryl-CoA dehydratase [Deltaproteobacteria bacterium]